jgi:hypothetical protein
MKIVILIAAACLLIVVGGQVYCLVNIDEAEETLPMVGSISGRLECGEVVERCCEMGPRFFLNFPLAPGQQREEGGAQGEMEAPCGEFFHLEGVKPGKHTLYIEYTLKGGKREFREIASLEVGSGQHNSLGTVPLIAR